MKSVINVEEETKEITLITEYGQVFFCESFFDAEALRRALERVSERRR